MNGARHIVYLMARHSNGSEIPEHDLEDLRKTLIAHGFDYVTIQRATTRGIFHQLKEWWDRLPA